MVLRITASRMLTGHLVIARGKYGSNFWSKSWLGELYPDDAYKGYVTDGNLATGGLTTGFHQVSRSLVVGSSSTVAPGTSFAHATGSRLGLAGSVR